MFLVLEYVGENFCSDEHVLNGLKIVGYLLAVAKLFVPLLIVGFGILDLYKSVLAGSSDSMSKQIKSIGFRLIIGVFIFFIPTIINIVLNGLPNFPTDMKECQTAILNPFGYKPEEVLDCPALSISSCSSRSDCEWKGTSCGKKEVVLPCSSLGVDACSGRADCKWEGPATGEGSCKSLK